MAEIMIINGSPRAPKSNSKRYSEFFLKKCSLKTDYFAVTKKNHAEIIGKIKEYSDVLLVFPLYADSIPVTMLDFLKDWEKAELSAKPAVSVIINCGFYECRQNDVAIDMVRFFCKKNGLVFRAVLKIGSGEAIWDTPFKFFVEKKICKLASLIEKKESGTLCVSMPITKKMFIKASDIYWTKYGEKYGTTKCQMKTMDIEGR